MKSKIQSLFFWLVAGAVAGAIHASGILGLFHQSAKDLKHRDYWKPVTKEEYRSDMKRYPVYGAGAGLVVGVLFMLRAPRTKDSDENGQAE